MGNEKVVFFSDGFPFFLYIFSNDKSSVFGTFLIQGF